MSSSLGVTMSLPAGTLQSRRAEELARRKQKEQHQKEQQAAPSQPRRLAPQRKKKTPPSSESASSDQAREHLPISIPINVDDDGGSGELNQEFDDKSEQMNNITNNVADWTLRDADEKIRNYINEDDKKEEEEEQSYHGEIESVEDDNASDEIDSVLEEDSDDDGGYKVISEDDVPLDPPPSSMPMVLVDLEMLTGVVPYDEEEKEEIVLQLLEMLMGSMPEEDDNNDQEREDNAPQLPHDITKGDGLSLDFDERVVELFECGVARHVDSMMPAAIACADEEKKAANAATDSNGKAVYPFALIPYPEFLSSEVSPTSRSTIRLWKLLNNTHESPLLTRLFTHLRNTSRSLIWKADMYHELCSLARQEYKAQIQRKQKMEYNEWKETVRHERLEKLYDVRETFQLRVDVARRKHESFVEERELRVERELKRRGLYQYRITSRQYTEDNAKDGDEYYDEDGWGGAVNEEEIFGDEMGDIDESSHDQGDEWSPLGLKIVINTPEDSLKEVRKAKEELQNSRNLKQLEPITHSDNQNRKSEKSQRLKDQTSSSSTNNSFFEKKAAAIRKSLKTNEERIAEAVLANLEGKLQNVDDLLETLQEEEWADEEDDENNQLSLDCDEGKGVGEEMGEAEMTLLDQILAMILGALPKESSGATDEKEHFAFVKNEHASIISSWKETFGRLPPFPSSAQEPSESKEVMSKMSDTLDNHFGDPTMSANLRTNNWDTDRNEKIALIGNETSAWDEIDDWDSFFHSKI